MPWAFLLLLFAGVDGEKLYQQHQFNAAEPELRRALANRPSDARLRLILARTLIELGRVPEALAEIQRSLSSADPDIQFQAGKIAREMAERRFADLRRTAPDSAAVRELVGRQYELQGNLQEALTAYKAAIAKETTRPGLHFEAGNILWRLRELDAAQLEFETELARTPLHGRANLRLGQIYMARDDHARAVRLLERAVQAMPESIEAHRELGKAYRKADRLDAARVQWEAVAAMRPDDDQVHYLLGNLYRTLGKESLAIRELTKHREILQRRAKRD